MFPICIVSDINSVGETQFWEADSLSLGQEIRKYFGTQSFITVFQTPTLEPHPKPGESSAHSHLLFT
jgi:hypothetical protein